MFLINEVNCLIERKACEATNLMTNYIDLSCESTAKMPDAAYMKLQLFHIVSRLKDHYINDPRMQCLINKLSQR